MNLTDIYKNEKALLELANQCDEEYCKNSNGLYTHTPFDENNISFKLNLTGLISIINYIGTEPANNILNIIINLEFDEENIFINDLCILCNTAWNAQQPLRNRINKMNCYSHLNYSEKEKDWIQIKTTACFLKRYFNL